MKPRPMYYHFAQSSCAEQEVLVPLVVAQTAAEKIFLLGGTLLHRRTETLFTLASATATQTAHVYLLVLVQKSDEHTLACLQDKVETAARPLVPLTAMFMEVRQFNQWLAAGHPWALCIRQRAALLYDAGNSPFAEPGKTDEEERRKEHETLFQQGHTRVSEFLAGAELFSLRGQYRMAAFMLHQAAEQALRTMLILRTGLRINTHSIEKLLRYCAMFCHPLPDLFPAHNEGAKKLLGLLQKAYIDVRYKEDYSISREQLAELTRKVVRIRQLLEEYKP